MSTGVNEDDDYGRFAKFVDWVSRASSSRMIVVHARNAWLQGLSPKENREIPPLRYDWVYRLKRERPELAVVLNGGITSVEAGLDHLLMVDGVMLGRAAYQDPYILHQFDCALSNAPLLPRALLLRALRPYVGMVGARVDAQAHCSPSVWPISWPAWRSCIPPSSYPRWATIGCRLVIGGTGTINN